MNTKQQLHPVHPNQAVADSVMARHAADCAEQNLENQNQLVGLYARSIVAKSRVLKERSGVANTDWEKALLKAERAKFSRACRFARQFSEEAKHTSAHAIRLEKLAR